MKVKKEVFLKSGVSEVWKKVTDLSDQKWRSDIAAVESYEQGKKFVEISKQGVRTDFEVTLFEPVSRYECRLTNEKLEGKFTVLLSIAADGTPEKDGTHLILVEDVRAKNILLRPAVCLYLNAAMKKYIKDLRSALDESI